MGNITSSTDKNGNTTQYIYDDSYNLVETIDALGTSAHFEYDAMGRLTKTTLHRVDTQDNVDELEVTVYEYDGRGLTTKKIDALGNVTTYEYDGNGNLAAETDADGYRTEYTYNALDLVTSINYNNAKEVNYIYNATGDLVQMTDWLGTTTFEVDLLHQLKSVTDHRGNIVTYDYDSVGNQTAIHYPDGTTATYDYDLVQNQTKVTECDSSETTYTYDGMGRVTEMRYPNGWVEYYTYDAMGRILAVDDTHPSEKPAKTQKHTYEYDANGNLIYEYMRGNGTGQAKNETLYTYDALNRLITAHDNYGNSTRVYTYDSLGNLTYETGDGSHHMDYTYNNLNQLVTQSDDGWKTYTASSYDNRGNLVSEVYYKNKNTTNTIGQYFYDETNKMVRGINAAGEESLYSYNGLGALVENTWKIAQNGYGYHGVNADTSDNESHNGQGNGNSNGNSAGNNGNGNVKKISTVIKQFVPDYTTETYQPLTEHEVNGLDYRYVYSDKARLSVVVQGIENGSASVRDENGELHAYYHCDYLGTTDYLTSAVNSKVISWTYYNEWGEITHNAVLNCGARELDLVKLYATHDYDAVLNQFYAKARFYDADNRRFTAMDPILDPSAYDLKAYVNDPMQLVQYLYVKNNAVIYIDPLGLAYTAIIKNSKGEPIKHFKLTDTRYASSGYFWVREVDKALSTQNATLTAGYNSSKNQASISISYNNYPSKSQELYVALNNLRNGQIVKGMLKTTLNGQVTTKQSGIYFKFFSCWGNSRTYVDIEALAAYLGLSVDLYKTDNFSSTAYIDTILKAGYQSGDYLLRSANQVVFGNYTDDYTMLGTATQVLTGLAGVDLPADIRDVLYDLQNWEWTQEHVVNTGIDAAGLFPVIGVLKYGKYSDEIALIIKHGDKVDLVTSNTSKGKKVAAALSQKTKIRGIEYINDLINSNKKFTPEDLVAIGKMPNGKLIWLEEGTEKKGLQHIYKHSAEFIQAGIPKDEIPDFIMCTLEQGKVVGQQRADLTRPIYSVTYKGKLHKVAITVSDNGFIVGANMSS